MQGPVSHPRRRRRRAGRWPRLLTLAAACFPAASAASPAPIVADAVPGAQPPLAKPGPQPQLATPGPQPPLATPGPQAHLATSADAPGPMATPWLLGQVTWLPLASGTRGRVTVAVGELAEPAGGIGRAALGLALRAGRHTAIGLEVPALLAVGGGTRRLGVADLFVGAVTVLPLGGAIGGGAPQLRLFGSARVAASTPPWDAARPGLVEGFGSGFDAGRVGVGLAQEVGRVGMSVDARVGLPFARALDGTVVQPGAAVDLRAAASAAVVPGWTVRAGLAAAAQGPRRRDRDEVPGSGRILVAALAGAAYAPSPMLRLEVGGQLLVRVGAGAAAARPTGTLELALARAW